MLFPIFKIEDPGEFVGSLVFILAMLVKVFVELGKQFKLWFFKDKKEIPKTESNKEKFENEIEVLSKSDLEKLMEAVKAANLIIESNKDNNADAMGCIGVISILLRIMEKRALDATIPIVENEIYSYLRHNDFPSKLVVTAMFEKSIEEAKTQRKAEKDGLDTGSSN